MSSRVSRIGNFAHKQFDHPDIDRPPLVIQRSMMLSESGIRIPIPVWDAANREAVSPWIEGHTGRAYLAEIQSRGGLSQWKALLDSEQARLLGPMVQLHNISPTGLELQSLDLWRRITPRLADDSKLCPKGPLDKIGNLYHRLRDQQIAIEQSHEEPRVPVHGDYHVNQIIIAQRDRKPWLLDLDDMALGLPEIDLGNFITNLATNADLLIEGVMEDYQALKAMLCPTYVSLGGRVPDPTLIDFYAAVSLLRRLLKFYETGRRNPDPDEVLSACEMLACQFSPDGVNDA